MKKLIKNIIVSAMVKDIKFLMSIRHKAMRAKVSRAIRLDIWFTRMVIRVLS